MNESKVCASCGRTIEPRKRWKEQWDSIRYCSTACRQRRICPIDRQLEEAILTLLSTRRADASICPSEAARHVAGDDDWRALMEPVRRAARRLAHRGEVDILQRGRVIDAADIRGPVRVRRRLD